MTTTPTTQPFDLTGAIIAFESGELDDQGILNLFSFLIKTGIAWTLQGSYGRTATRLIRAGIITRNGNVVADLNVIPATPELPQGQ